MSGIEERLADLEARVAALESERAVPGGDGGPAGGRSGSGGAQDGPAGAQASPAGSPAGGPAGGDTGRLVYGGEARLGGRAWAWQVARSPGWLVERPAAPLAAVLAAAGHPARLRILQLLVVGPRPIAELQSELNLASQGQLYHHLKTLTSAGLVEQPERGVYRVPPTAVFPVLTLAAAAVDVAGAS
ncbi:ArsR/SmtB family transcription factor [Nonomuraea sp. NPDC047897]|uniref:ArsR/SmtB family transcription factor n=1 Tax=Nonomuraea sp. NPDC047897 TaxID=3364346 RepID=UPI00371B30E3